MNKPKANVGKSKSSNVTIATKVECCKNKKSLSNAEFQSKVLKKRGVYVEKKVTKTNLLKKSIDTVLKSPSRKRPGKKKFLTSVLTILSKSSAGTQYDLDNDKLEKTILKARKGTTEYDEMFRDNAMLNNNNHTSKKKKYKSKILNDRLNESDQVVVLRSKMDIVQTPSNYSDKSNVEIKWTNFPRLVKAEEDEGIQKDTEETAIYHCVADGIGKITGKKVTIDTEPTTLVSDKPKDKLYNFFVDLLETTFSVYNVNTEFIKPPSISSSRIALQIDESVAKKLEIKKDFDDVNEKPSKYFSINNNNAKWDDDKLLQHFQSKPLSIKLSDELLKKKKRRTKSDNKKIMKTQSFFLPTKKSNRKHMKKNLLTLFKEQLMMDAESYEEPENLYQALKVMAKNKRRKTIQFDHVTKYDDDNATECRFKRRKIYTTSKKPNKKHYKPESELLRSMTRKLSADSTDFSAKVDNVTNYKTDFDESRHSLEVFGYDFVENISKRETSVTEKEILFTYHSSPSVSDYDTNEAIMRYFDSSETLQNAYKSSHHGLKSVSELIKER